MESRAFRSAVQRLRHVVAAPTSPTGLDADLLRAFTAHRDVIAFEQIVRRHGPMVLGTCRRVLRDPADADDAFQATFLVLVRKAGTLRAPDRLAGWLYQVAHRVAKKARAVRLNRARREGDLFDVPTGEPPAEVIWRELRPIFDAELDRLPDRLRLPAVLCLLEGLSKAEAARVLGWPEGTVSCRLQRARERLRTRLSARGLTMSSGALAVALFEGTGSAAVPDWLITSTMQSVLSPATAAAARALADGVTQAMFLTKVKAVAAGVLVAGIVGTGSGVVLVPGPGPVQIVAGEPAKDTPPKGLPSGPRTEGTADPKGVAVDLDRSIKQQELELLKERLAWEEKMVKKGYFAESQVKMTRLKVAQAEAALSQPAAMDLAEAERKAMDATIKKLEEIVQQTRTGVERGVVPVQELYNSEATLARYKLMLQELEERPRVGRAPLSAERRAAMEAIIQKLEDIVRLTEEGVKKGIVPQQELLNAQLKLLEHRFKFIEMTGPAVEDPPAAMIPSSVRERDARITLAETALARAEALARQNAITQSELRRLKIHLGRMRAEAATARGDHAAASKHRDAVTADLEAQVAATRQLVERRQSTRSELRVAETALAEARVEALKAGVRQQLAGIVTLREEDLREARAHFEAKVNSASEVRQAEAALAEARARLAAER